MEPDPAKEDSVLDFLYIDSQRIALFLSQFSQYGHLTALAKSTTASSSLAGGLNIQLAKLDGTESEQSTLSKQYSAQWVAPLTFLDEADQRGMIVRGITAARIGQLVLASGALEVRDLTIIKKAFALPAMKSHLGSLSDASKSDTSRQVRRRDQRAKGAEPKQEFSIEQFGLQFLAELPHALHASLYEGQSRIWCSLREDCLLISANDLFLKHGVKISGDWKMLGILDALPEGEGQTTPAGAQSQMEQAQAAMPQGEFGGLVTLVNEGFGGFIDGIAPLARMFLGRPSRAYGLTPLLIFRAISA